MADIVVKDLQDLAVALTELIDQFQGALDLQNDDKGIWGQHNANLSMGDFAHNWTVHRDAMVKSMKALRDKVNKIDEAWTNGDQEMLKQLKEKK